MGGESLIEQLRRREEQRRRPAQEARAEEEPTARAADAGGEPAGDGEPGAAPGEEEVNTVAYGYFRGVRERSTHVEFQRLKGSWPAPGYAWLPCPVWAPSGTGKGRGQAIVLEYVTGLKVTIRGRNLRPLHERILRQQVFRVTEMGEEADRYLPDEATVIYAIEVVEPEDEEELKDRKKE